MLTVKGVRFSSVTALLVISSLLAALPAAQAKQLSPPEARKASLAAVKRDRSYKQVVMPSKLSVRKCVSTSADRSNCLVTVTAATPCDLNGKKNGICAQVIAHRYWNVKVRAGAKRPVARIASHADSYNGIPASIGPPFA